MSRCHSMGTDCASLLHRAAEMRFPQLSFAHMPGPFLNRRERVLRRVIPHMLYEPQLVVCADDPTGIRQLSPKRPCPDDKACASLPPSAPVHSCSVQNTLLS